jgi:RimJ/RimL family protein N-acetyltransferase
MPLQAIDPITSERIGLREVVAADLSDLMQVNGDSEVTRFLPYKTWEQAADATAWLERMQGLAAGGAARQLVIVRNEDKQVIGTALLFKFDEGSQRIELGYVIGRTHWRQGYAREALRVLLSHLFASLKVRRVEAEVNPHNEASIALLLSLGFTCEGHLRERWLAKGAVYGVNVYGLLSREWQQNPR